MTVVEIFVVFFLWRSLLEPEEVRAYPQSLLVLMGLCALVSIWYAWKLRKSTQAPTDEIRFNKHFKTPCCRLVYKKYPGWGSPDRSEQYDLFTCAFSSSF